MNICGQYSDDAVDVNGQNIAAIISRYFPVAERRDHADLTAANRWALGEIERLTSEIETPRCNECNAVLGDNWCADCAGRTDRERLATARADAIGEAIEAIKRVPVLNYAGRLDSEG